MRTFQRRKMFSAENIFKENDFSENIFWRKPFYVEVNRALIRIYSLYYCVGAIGLNLDVWVPFPLPKDCVTKKFGMLTKFKFTVILHIYNLFAP